MFSNFQLYFKTIDGHVDQDGQETPRMDTTADGWSSVYTFEHVLLVLQVGLLNHSNRPINSVLF